MSEINTTSQWNYSLQAVGVIILMSGALLWAKLTEPCEIMQCSFSASPVCQTVILKTSCFTNGLLKISSSSLSHSICDL